MNNNQTIIINGITNESIQETKVVIQQLLQQKIVSPLQRYLKQIQPIYNKILNANNRSLLVAASGDDYKKIKNDLYIEIKKITEEYKNLLPLLKSGYILIEEIRETFTGKTITYEIGFPVGRGKGRNYYRKELSMKEILKLGRIEIDWHNMMPKIRLNLNKADRETLSSSSISLSGDKTFESIFDYYFHLSKEQRKVLGNAGVFYEAYVNARVNYPNKKLDKFTLERIFKESRNSTRFYKGGDVNNIQVKGFFGSPASLVSLDTIINVCKNLLFIYENFSNELNIEKLFKSLSEMFTTEGINIGESGEKHAIEYSEAEMISYLQKQLSGMKNIRISSA